MAPGTKFRGPEGYISGAYVSYAYIADPDHFICRLAFLKVGQAPLLNLRTSNIKINA